MSKQQTKRISELRKAEKLILRALAIIEVEQANAREQQMWPTAESLKYQVETLKAYLSSDSGECGLSALINILNKKIGV